MWATIEKSLPLSCAVFPDAPEQSQHMSVNAAKSESCKIWLLG